MPVLGILPDKKDGSDLGIDISSLEVIYNGVNSSVSNWTGLELLDLDIISNLRDILLDLIDARILFKILLINLIRLISWLYNYLTCDYLTILSNYSVVLYRI